MTNVDARYAKATSLWSGNLRRKVVNASPVIGWLDDTHVVYRSGPEIVVVDVTSGQRRTATAGEAATAPEVPPDRSVPEEGEPRSQLVMSPDQTAGLGQSRRPPAMCGPRVAAALTRRIRRAPRRGSTPRGALR